MRKLIMVLVGATAGYQTYGQQGALLGGVIGLIISFLINPRDTVNYILRFRGKRVYDGIAYEDRIDKRISEHAQDGKIFDHVHIDEPNTRERARDLEKKRIRRFKSKYNINGNPNY